MASSLKCILATCFLLICHSSFAAQELITRQAVGKSTSQRNTLTSEVSTPNHISLAAEDDWPPFADQYGNGISHQLIHAAFEQVNISVNTILVPYSRGLKMATEGSVDGVFNVAKLKNLENDFIFGKQPLFLSNSVFFHSKRKPLLAKNKSQLQSGTRIGKIKDFFYGDEINMLTQVSFVEVDNQYQLINLLLAGRIDGALMYQEVAQRFIEQMKVTDEIVPAFKNQECQIFLVFSKETPYAEHLVNEFDLGLKKLIQNGKYQEIVSGYAQTPYTQ